MRKIFAIIVCCCWFWQVAAQPNITAAEYFIDIDPGFGNATRITIATPSTNITNQAFTVALGTVPQGVHCLFIRSRDAGGKWSVANRFVFYKASPGTVAGNIVKAEYFFDTDPGFGNALNIPVTAGSDVQNINFTASMGALPPGVHQLFLRSQNANGKWSITSRFIIYKQNPANGLPPADITSIEYFIDTDPGFDNAVPLAINPAPGFSDFIMPVNISGLSVGNHRLYIRSRSSTGMSITNVYTFNIAATAVSPAIKVNAVAKKQLCARDSVKVSFDARGTYNAGNTFNVELSNAAGSFASPVIIGSNTGIKSAIIACRIPQNTLGGTNYRVRVSSTNPVVTGLPGNDALTIGNWPNLGADTTVYQLCSGGTVNLNPLYNTTGLTAVWNTATPGAVVPGNYRLLVTNSYGCTDTAFAVTLLEVATWTGASSSDWHTAANWSIGKVPTGNTHVIIPGGTPNPCIISSSNISAASIQARNGATVQILNNRLADIKGKCSTLPPN
jgi:hypothetical protein